ncbi:hypothetical protein DPMN_094313 [Dreissena polymorpha]|uniref:Uncharacterized protein n=1 Tax=Dreissena polymorpha TaxID=45954 RepID=A0A9D4L599_DREPO|nr:hypothetical protein DPMN_094313 [Dreissena polymorpha]
MDFEGHKETTTATEPVSRCNDRDYGDGLYIEGTVEDISVVLQLTLVPRKRGASIFESLQSAQ